MNATTDPRDPRSMKITVPQSPGDAGDDNSIPVTQFTVPEEHQHPYWSKEPLTVVSPISPVLAITKADAVMNWVVKLRFKQGGEVKYGSAFVVNIPTRDTKGAPDPKIDPTHIVILTAAHNLVDKDGIPSSNMTVIACASKEPHASPTREEIPFDITGSTSGLPRKPVIVTDPRSRVSDARQRLYPKPCVCECANPESFERRIAP